MVKRIFLMMLEICEFQKHVLTLVCTLRVAERENWIRLVELCR